MQMMRLEVNDDRSTAAIYVKVSMDGAPYLRKIDLKVYMGYRDLRENLEDMFKCFSLGKRDKNIYRYYYYDSSRKAEKVQLILVEYFCIICRGVCDHL